MDRMSALDAEFLHLEDSTSHMHIAGVCTFADPPPPFEHFEAMVAAKLHEIPRYRQRVRGVPLDLGRPVWVDDPHFNLGYHLRHTALPPPGNDVDLCNLMGRLMSQPLDRERPLWETWLVEGLDQDRWALVFKLHHCMVDGIAGVGLLEMLLDIEPVTQVAEPQPWTPDPEPSAAAKVLNAWRGALGDAGRPRRVPRRGGARSDRLRRGRPHARPGGWYAWDPSCATRRSPHCRDRSDPIGYGPTAASPCPR